MKPHDSTILGMYLFGPVFPNVHRHVDYTEFTPLTESCFEEINKDTELLNSMSRVIDAYAKFKATQLSSWSHKEGSPWDRTTKLDGFKWSRVIPDDYIREYFKMKKVI